MSTLRESADPCRPPPEVAVRCGHAGAARRGSFSPPCQGTSPPQLSSVPSGRRRFASAGWLARSDPSPSHRAFSIPPGRCRTLDAVGSRPSPAIPPGANLTPVSPQSPANAVASSRPSLARPHAQAPNGDAGFADALVAFAGLPMAAPRCCRTARCAGKPMGCTAPCATLPCRPRGRAAAPALPGVAVLFPHAATPACNRRLRRGFRGRMCRQAQ